VSLSESPLIRAVVSEFDKVVEMSGLDKALISLFTKLLHALVARILVFNDSCCNSRGMKRQEVGENSGNACYHSVQNLLSSRLMSKNIKVRIYRTIILPVVLYGCETWYLTLREEHRLKDVSEQGVENIWTKEG
jgi:hypothetical protein